MLIFLGYNSSILTKEWKWAESSIAYLDIIFHLTTAFGGVISIFTCNISTRNGLSYGILLSFLAFFFAIPLVNIRTFILYIIILFVICFSNGHLQNICTTLIVKKYSKNIRAAVYVFAYFFTQFGKFLFACIIYNFNDRVISADIAVTVYPILIILILQVIFNLLLVNKMKTKKIMKEDLNQSQSSESESQPEDSPRGKINVGNFIEINLPENSNNISNNENINNNIRNLNNNYNILPTFYEPIIQLMTLNKKHSFNLIFLNMSLGIQFFSMINVFPLLKNKTSSIMLVDEILISKAYHTIFLLFLPILYIFHCTKRKSLLTFTFGCSLIFNILIILEIFNSSLLIHFFRFIWNVCFITINLYCAEGVVDKLRGANTAIMYMIFKISCVVEILTIDKLISFNIYVPILLNVFILFSDILLVDRLQVETHMKSIEEIESEINYLYS